MGWQQTPWKGDALVIPASEQFYESCWPPAHPCDGGHDTDPDTDECRDCGYIQ